METFPFYFPSENSSTRLLCTSPFFCCCKRQDKKSLKYKIFIFENVFIREKQNKTKNQNHTNCLVTSIPH